MPDYTLQIFLADLILIVHFLFVAFVITGFICIVCGRFIGWQWIYRFGFRCTHLLAITIVAGQSWLGRLCPLTIWESELRSAAGQAAYQASFIQHWLQGLLYYEFPFQFFVWLYSLFGLAVVVTLIVDRQRIFRRRGSGGGLKDW